MKYVLLIWIGFGANQTMAIDHFDTLEECSSVVSALLTSKRLSAECLPYFFGNDTQSKVLQAR
jgi:hypothetical protein